MRNPPAAYVTAMLVPRGGTIRVDWAALALLGVRHILEVSRQGRGLERGLGGEGREGCKRCGAGRAGPSGV